MINRSRGETRCEKWRSSIQDRPIELGGDRTFQMVQVGIACFPFPALSYCCIEFGVDIGQFSDVHTEVCDCNKCEAGRR